MTSSGNYNSIDWEDCLETAKLEGLEEGREKATLAKNMKDRGIPTDVIAKSTGLALDEITGI